MAESDTLVEIIETMTVTVETPSYTKIESIEQPAINSVELVITDIPVAIDVDGPSTTKLELLDGDLFVATNDGLLGTRVRQITNTLITDATVFQIPANATRLFNFSLNGIDYIENVVLQLGSGVITFTPGPDGYSPMANDFLSILYSE